MPPEPPRPMSPRILNRRAAVGFGVADAVAAALVAFGVYGALPARWWVVDVGAACVVAALAASALGLLRATAWAERVARIAAFVVLGMGLALIATLVLTASYLAGIYGPVGLGGAVILILVTALVIPYLFVLPTAQLLWLGPDAGRRTASGAPSRGP